MKLQMVWAFTVPGVFSPIIFIFSLNTLHMWGPHSVDPLGFLLLGAACCSPVCLITKGTHVSSFSPTSTQDLSPAQEWHP